MQPACWRSEVAPEEGASAWATSSGLELTAPSRAEETQCPVQTAEMDGLTARCGGTFGVRPGDVWIK